MANVFTPSPGEAAANAAAENPGIAITPLTFSPAASQAAEAAYSPISLSTSSPGAPAPVSASAPAPSGMSTGEIVGLIALGLGAAGIIYWALRK